MWPAHAFPLFMLMLMWSWSVREEASSSRGALRKNWLWRNNFLVIRQQPAVDPVDTPLITKSMAVNFHSCRPHRSRGAAGLCLPAPPLKLLALTPPLGHQSLKLRPQRFSPFSQAAEKTPNRHWLVEDRPSLMKSKLSIRAPLLHAGTNEARRSPALIPLHLTHFIDSPCFSNEMLNISPSAEARWQPLWWRWSERRAHLNADWNMVARARARRAELKAGAPDLYVQAYQGSVIVDVAPPADMDQLLTDSWSNFFVCLIKCQLILIY